MSKDDELKERIDDAIEGYRDVTLSFVESASDEEAPVVMEALFKAICYELGNVEGMAVLSGATKKNRDESRSVMVRQGMEEALQNHDEGPCDGCEASEDLRRELFSN